MATTHDKLLVSIPQLKSERDWLVWKFQVTHALKASDQWNHITGTANTEGTDYESKKQSLLLSFAMHWSEVCAHGDELSYAKRVVGRALSILCAKDC